ncbi:hypothetical protein H8959_004010, partial [Pygathrix nigripes]
MPSWAQAPTERSQVAAGRARRQSAQLPGLPQAIPEESSGPRLGEEADEKDPGDCAPASLPRRRRLQVSAARFPPALRGRAAPRCRRTDPPTDIPSSGCPTRRRPPQARTAAPSAPGPRHLRPLRGQREREGDSAGTLGGRSPATPAGRAGRAPCAGQDAPQPPRNAPWGRCGPQRGRPDHGHRDPGKGRPVEWVCGVIPIPRTADGSLFSLWNLVFSCPCHLDFVLGFSMAAKPPASLYYGRGRERGRHFVVVARNPRTVWSRLGRGQRNGDCL